MCLFTTDFSIPSTDIHEFYYKIPWLHYTSFTSCCFFRGPVWKIKYFSIILLVYLLCSWIKFIIYRSKSSQFARKLTVYKIFKIFKFVRIQGTSTFLLSYSVKVDFGNPRRILTEIPILTRRERERERIPSMMVRDHHTVMIWLMILWLLDSAKAPGIP